MRCHCYNATFCATERFVRQKKKTPRSYFEMGRYTNVQLVEMVPIPLYFETAREPMTLGGTPLSTSSNPHPPTLSAHRTSRKDRLNLRSSLGTRPSHNPTFWQPPSPWFRSF